MVEAGKKEKKS